jgi:hypothetical protein
LRAEVEAKEEIQKKSSAREFVSQFYADTPPAHNTERPGIGDATAKTNSSSAPSTNDPNALRGGEVAHLREHPQRDDESRRTEHPQFENPMLELDGDGVYTTRPEYRRQGGGSLTCIQISDFESQSALFKQTGTRVQTERSPTIVEDDGLPRDEEPLLCDLEDGRGADVSVVHQSMSPAGTARAAAARPKALGCSLCDGTRFFRESSFVE